MKRYAIMTSQSGYAIDSYDTATEAVEQVRDFSVRLGSYYGIKDNQDGSYTSFDELKKVFPNIFNMTGKQNFRNEVVFPNIFDAAVYSLTNDGTGKKYNLTDDGTGKKYDTGKSMVGTLVNVFPEALMAVGMCIEFGTHKYPNPNNWKQVEGADKRYQDSLMRHLIKHNAGIEKDSETNLLHLAHMAWNALAILQLYIMNHPEYKEEYFK